MQQPVEPKKGAATKAKAPPKPKANAQRKTELANASIQMGPTVLKTVAGDIFEWLPVPENLPRHPTMAFFGKRRTGKSTTITNIAFHCCQNIPFGIVMSDTAFAG